MVLYGALSFAIPLRFGQMLEIYNNKSNQLHWQAYENGSLWLNFTISVDEIRLAIGRETSEKDFVCYLLRQARKLNPDFLADLSYTIKTEINFDRNWGLGSSSSLINNVAQWAQVNPYELHSMVSKGSGYDIACANYCKPILFKRDGIHPTIYPVDFNPKFVNQLYFVYLGNKQDSEKSVLQFLNENHVTSNQLESISLISKKVLQSDDPNEFDALMLEHEQLISNALGCKTIKEKQFSDMEGSVKSLGAWGGDFILVRTNWGKQEVNKYFFEKGFSVIFSWKNIILK